MHSSAREVAAHALEGNVIDLGDGRSAAIYRLDRSSWVAEFQGGRGTLVDAASWFRCHGSALRYSHGRRAAALASITPISPELSDQIRRLHHVKSGGETGVPKATPTFVSALWRWCTGLALRGGRARFNNGAAAATRRDPNHSIVS